MLFSCNERKPNLPSYVKGQCLKERLRFVASGQKNSFDYYKIKKVTSEDMDLYRYASKKWFFYKTYDAYDFSDRALVKAKCPDKAAGLFEKKN